MATNSQGDRRPGLEFARVSRNTRVRVAWRLSGHEPVVASSEVSAAGVNASTVLTKALGQTSLFTLFLKPPKSQFLISPGGFMDQRVEKILKTMRENLHQDLSLAELAQSVNLSIWRLSHVFRSAVGMSPIQYLRFLKMERAKYLLETSFLSVKEITYQVGLRDESHFVRDFKKSYGVPPTTYRTAFNRQHLNKSDDDSHTREGRARKKSASR